MKKHQRATAALFAILLFGSGLAIGALVSRFYAIHVVNAKGPEDFRQHYIAQMRSRLNLTGQQVTELEGIMDETRGRYRGLRPMMAKIKQDHIQHVKSILTPEQVPLYERLLAEEEHHGREQEKHGRQHGR